MSLAALCLIGKTFSKATLMIRIVKTAEANSEDGLYFEAKRCYQLYTKILPHPVARIYWIRTKFQFSKIFDVIKKHKVTAYDSSQYVKKTSQLLYTHFYTDESTCLEEKRDFTPGERSCC